MSSGHASEDEFASAESDAEDSGEGGSLDEQQGVEGMGVGLDEGVGCDEGEGTGPDEPVREPKEGSDQEAMQGAVATPPQPVLVHAREGAGPIQEKKKVDHQVDGSGEGMGGKVKEGVDRERVAEEVHRKEIVDVKPEEAQQSSIAAKDEHGEVASSKQLQGDLPEQEMDRRVEVMKRLEDAAAGGSEQGGGWGWGWGQSIWSSVSSVASADKLGKLGQGLSSVIHQVEEGLGFADSEEPATQGSDRGEVQGNEPATQDGGRGEAQGVRKEPSQERDTKPEGEQTGTTVVTEEPHHDDEGPAVGESAKEGPRTTSSTSEGNEGSFWSGLEWGVGSIAEASKGLMSTGMDALESVGRKTMDILAEGDPGLKKKREMFIKEHPTLSQMLREAKEKAENVARYKCEEEGEVSLSLFLDEYQGLAHLEALELLSKECGTKVNLLKQSSGEGSTGTELEGQLSALKEWFESDLDSAEEPTCEQGGGAKVQSDATEDIQQLFKGLSLPVRVDKIVRAIKQWRDRAVQDRDQGDQGEETTEVEPVDEDGTRTEPESGSGDAQQTDGAKVKSQSVVDAGDVFEHGMRCLAEVVSYTIDVFRKTGELSLIPEMKEVSSTEVAEKAKSLSGLVKQELSSLADAFGKAIQSKKSPEAQGLVTSLFLETSHSCSHIQDAFQLLLPVMELRTINHHQSS